MAALSADVIRPQAENAKQLLAYTSANGVQNYVGGFTDIVAGVAQPHTIGHTIQGCAVGPGVPGNDPNMDGFATPPASAIAPGNNVAPRNQVVLDLGSFTLLNVLAIAGAAGAQADVDTKVFLLNDNDMTTAPQGGDPPLGQIASWSQVNGVNTWSVYVYALAARTITS